MKFKIMTVYDRELNRMIKDVPKLQNYIDSHQNLCELINKKDYTGRPCQELLININKIDELLEFRSVLDIDIIISREKDSKEEYNFIEIYNTWRE